MMIKCDICGYEFDYTDALVEDCVTCGQPRPKCPECKIDIDLPRELEIEFNKKHKENSIFTKMEEELGL